MSVNKTERSQKRYNHWFWNSCAIRLAEGLFLSWANFLWNKQYNLPQKKTGD